MVEIDIPLNVIPKARPRVVAHGNVRQVYTPKQDEFYQEMWALLPRHARNLKLEGPLEIRMAFWRRTRHPSDGDNLEKAVLDALVKLAVINDDRDVQACCWIIVEQGPEVQPRCKIEIRDFTWEAREGAEWTL